MAEGKRRAARAAARDASGPHPNQCDPEHECREHQDELDHHPIREFCQELNRNVQGPWEPPKPEAGQAEGLSPAAPFPWTRCCRPSGEAGRIRSRSPVARSSPACRARTGLKNAGAGGWSVLGPRPCRPPGGTAGRILRPELRRRSFGEPLSARPTPSRQRRASRLGRSGPADRSRSQVDIIAFPDRRQPASARAALARDHPRRTLQARPVSGKVR